MIELKRFDIVGKYADEDTVYEFRPDGECYDADEVDKLIENLKHQRDGAFGLANSGLTLDDLSQMSKKEIDRQKYKRCLAMARWCFTKSNYHFVVGRSEGGKTGMTHFHISSFYSKLYNRWLNIAEQFKEAK